MTKTNLLLPIILLSAAVAIAAILGLGNARASAPSGLPSVVATTSTPTVNTTAALIVATSSCSARVISSAGSPLMLTFSENQSITPSASVGFFQSSSTTVVYDSGQFGCGAIQAYSATQSTITIMESR